jgi:hypothetical protein
MGLSHLSGDEIAAWVESSCASQGVPVKVTDALVVRQVGALLGAASDDSRAQPRSGSTRDDARRSVAPHDADTARVQDLDPWGSGSDHGMVDHRSHDRVLARKVQTAPRST